MSHGWAPYVPVAKRRANAKKEMKKLAKQGHSIQPIEKTGRKITNTFWGNAWCTHLEQFGDYSNRLPRGRTYVRNGSVCHLEIKKGQVKAMVMGSTIYHVNIEIQPLAKEIWNNIKKKCVGQVGSLLELLQGKLSSHVMKTVTASSAGLFPKKSEIKLACDCPDWAEMCKHIAAVLYGIGARLDQSPELLFLLRDVNQLDLINSEVKIPARSRQKPKISGDLSDIFGVDIAQSEPTIKQDKNNNKPNKKKMTNTHKTQKTIDISQGIKASDIKALRRSLNITALELSTMIDKSVTSIRRWERSKGSLKLHPLSQKALEELFRQL